MCIRAMSACCAGPSVYERLPTGESLKFCMDESG